MKMFFSYGSRTAYLFHAIRIIYNRYQGAISLDFLLYELLMCGCCVDKDVLKKIIGVMKRDKIIK
ncbi:hypothetical protein LCGC14_2372530 [marine sediment metagenome]|uniref:Uncharacterized protein n=1 Tax=marine sediment metagenome TaxID=412755 RepID=A0A0F9CQM7_9ZZZZ